MARNRTLRRRTDRLSCLSSASGRVCLRQPTKHHALSLIGAPKHGPDFTHFDWVNPNAPKGGRVAAMGDGHLRLPQPFPVKGNPAAGCDLIYDS